MHIRQLKAARPIYVVLLLGLAFGAATGCGDDAPAGAACREGDTRECLGPGACKGAQECKADGSGFQPCVCGTGGTPNAGGDANEPTPGGAGSGTDTGGTPGTDTGGTPGTAGSGEPTVGGSATEGGAGGVGGSPVEYECQPVGNVGCDATHNCSIDGGVDPQCVTAGTTDVLEPCLQTGECAPGLSCHFNNCLKVCAETADCDTADATIKCGLGFVNEQVGLVGSCVKGCDVVTQDCPNGQACYLGSCLTPTLAHTEGGACGFATDCAEGLDCLVDRDGDTQNDCSPYCSTAVQNPCGVGFVCFPLIDAFPTVPAAWGVCAPE